jgi:hypothetical protein
METIDEKAKMLAALRAWIEQRPGLEFGNYGELKAYRAELRGITRDLHDARALLAEVYLSGMPADVLRDAFRAYSGRLSWDGNRLEYVTGQYWPTEYRRAVCAVAAAALWDWYRDSYAAAARDGESAGDAIRRCFRQEFGAGLAKRWFN